ncbi:MAG: response regulator [Pseudolabrys sp.]|nr:response regulator [Pseudolabrys sp.]
MAKTEALLAGKRCLVLEDEFLIALDLQDILEQAGAVVTCVATADEALAALEGPRFDFAILDVQLGGAARTSLSVAAALSARNTPFIFLTGLHRGSPLTATYPDAPILEKPYHQEAVLTAIRSILPSQSGK